MGISQATAERDEGTNEHVDRGVAALGELRFDGRKIDRGEEAILQTAAGEERNRKRGLGDQVPRDDLIIGQVVRRVIAQFGSVDRICPTHGNESGDHVFGTGIDFEARGGNADGRADAGYRRREIKLPEKADRRCRGNVVLDVVVVDGP